MLNINVGLFSECCGNHIDPTMWLDAYQKYAKAYGLDNALRSAAFWGQCLHETGRLRYTSEIWGPTPQQKKYELPNKKAIELGNTEVGDGKLFRGRGLIQTTGRANYMRVVKRLNRPDIMTNPGLLATPDLAIQSAMIFWDDNKLNLLADNKDFKAISKKVNGGTNGLKERIELSEAMLKVFSDV